jgi:hypothetical protein
MNICLTLSKPRPIKPFYFNTIIISCPSPFKVTILLRYFTQHAAHDGFNLAYQGVTDNFQAFFSFSIAVKFI